MTAADIVLTPYTSGAEAFAQPYVDEECVVIELKCESYWNAQKFRGEVKKDIQKVKSGGFKERLLRGGCNVYCVALAITDEGAYDMESLGLELFEGSVAAPFQVWWFEREDVIEEEDDDDDEEEHGDGEDDDMQEDGVDFAVDEASSDDDGQQSRIGNGYESGYHRGHNAGWDYNYA
ncbi:hypothetical protein APSETT445_000262 [Aspergillus pseudonomiae]